MSEQQLNEDNIKALALRLTIDNVYYYYLDEWKQVLQGTLTPKDFLTDNQITNFKKWGLTI